MKAFIYGVLAVFLFWAGYGVFNVILKLNEVPFITELTLAAAVLFFISWIKGLPSLFKAMRHYDKAGRGGYIYAFNDWGQLPIFIKIGYAKNLNQRMAAHKTAAPLGLYILSSFTVNDRVYAEAFLHKRYARYRIRAANEWFILVSPYMLLDLLFLRFVL